MPMMRPPAGYNGVIYNGIKVPTDGEVQILDADVAAHLAAGWSLGAPITMPATAADAPEGDDR